jgi:hypothetical protein
MTIRCVLPGKRFTAVPQLDVTRSSRLANRSHPKPAVFETTNPAP